MANDWLILHTGALGDLILTIQLALRLPGVGETGALRVVSRTNPGDLSARRPSIVRQSSEGLGLHWLFGDHDDRPPERLRDLVRGARVLSALGGVHTIMHYRLTSLELAAVYSIDPRPREGPQRHITQQWQTQLEAQGLLVPKCVHQRPMSPLKKGTGTSRERVLTMAEAAGLGASPLFQRTATQRGLGVPDDLRRRGRCLLEECFHAAPGQQSLDRQRGAVPPFVAPSLGRSVASPDCVSSAGPVACAPGSDRGRDRIVVIHPGSGGRAKCWPLPAFIELGRRLNAVEGLSVVFMVGPVELETWREVALAPLTAEFAVLRCSEPDELAAVLAAACVFVGNDAGPAHLAALLGTATVTLFGPTTAGVWRPLGPNVHHLAGDPETHPDNWGIQPEQVLSLLRAQL